MFFFKPFRFTVYFAFILQIALSTLTANAAPITWNLQNVTFEDGGTAKGFFKWDSAAASGAQLLDFDIDVEGGNTALFPAFNYAFSNIIPETLSQSISFLGTLDDVSVSLTVLRLTSDNFSEGRFRELRLVFSPLLTDDGGTVPIFFVDPKFGTLQSVECFNCGPSRLIVSGEAIAVAVPEPEIYAMLLGGLGLLGLMARRAANNTGHSWFPQWRISPAPAALP